jgi:hypothetical protein
MNIKYFKFFLIFLAGILTINTASAGFEIVITSIPPSVPPGGTAVFELAINPLSTLNEREYVELLLTDADDNPAGWNNRFSKNMFPVGPYPAGDTADLQIDIPTGTPEGMYYLNIKGNGYLPDPGNPSLPDLSYVAEDVVIPIYVGVYTPPVAELPTAILMGAGIFGLLFVTRRKI